jgi:hypothetical protein
VDDEARPPEVKRRQGSQLRAERPEPPPPIGGTLEVPDHPPTHFDRVPRAAKLAGAGLILFLAASAALWVAGELGWRRNLALIGSALVLLGLLVLPVARPTQDFLDGVRGEQRRAGLPVTEMEELRRGQTGFRLAVAAAVSRLERLPLGWRSGVQSCRSQGRPAGELPPL